VFRKAVCAGRWPNRYEFQPHGLQERMIRPEPFSPSTCLVSGEDVARSR
jgi:hypothetical protein